MAASREEKFLMRQRGAATRQIKDVGFALVLPCQNEIPEISTCTSSSRRKTVAKEAAAVKAPQTKVTKLKAGGSKRRAREIAKPREEANEDAENDQTIPKEQPGKNRGKRASRPVKVSQARRAPLEEIDNGAAPSVGADIEQHREEQGKEAIIVENQKPRGRKRKAGVEKVEEPAKRPRTISSSEELIGGEDGAHRQSIKEARASLQNVPHSPRPSAERRTRPIRTRKTRGTEAKRTDDKATSGALSVKASNPDTGSEEEHKDLGSAVLSKSKGRRRKAPADEDPNSHNTGSVMQSTNRMTKGRPTRSIPLSEEKPLPPNSEHHDIPPGISKSPVPIETEKPVKRGRPKAKKVISEEEFPPQSPCNHDPPPPPPPPPAQEENAHPSTTTTEQPPKRGRGARRPKANAKSPHDDDPPDATLATTSRPTIHHHHQQQDIDHSPTDPPPSSPLPPTQSLHPRLPTTSPQPPTSLLPSLRTHLSRIIKSQTGLPARLTALQAEAHRLRNSGKTPNEMGFRESEEEMEILVRRMEGVVRKGGEIQRGRKEGMGGRKGGREEGGKGGREEGEG